MLKILIILIITTTGFSLMQLKNCEEEILTDHICKVQEEYDKNKVPGKPTHDVVEVNEKHFTITILLRIDVRWEDRNLKYKPNIT